MPVSEQTDVALRSVFPIHFSVRFVAAEDYHTAKVSEEVNRNLRARNALVQLSLYTDPERHNAQRNRRTNRRTTS